MADAIEVDEIMLESKEEEIREGLNKMLAEEIVLSLVARAFKLID